MQSLEQPREQQPSPPSGWDDTPPLPNRTEFDWARTQLSIGACAIELGGQLGLSETATEELAKSLLGKASTQDYEGVKKTVHDLWEALQGYGVPSLGTYLRVPEANVPVASVVSMSEFKQRQTAKPKRPKSPAKRRRQLKQETPFLAPSKKMSDPEILAHFLPEDEADHAGYIRKVCGDIKSDLESEKERDKDLEYALSDQTSRGMSLMVHVANHYRLNELGDPRAKRAISEALGLYVKSMNPYIYKIAEHSVHENSALTLEDLISEGELGLIESLGRFDLGWEGMKFLGYARRRIQGAIIDAVREKAAVIRVSRGDMVRAKHHREMTAQGKTMEEVAEFLDTTPERLERSLARFKGANALALDQAVQTSSTRGDEDMSLADTVVDHGQNVEEQAIGSDAVMVDLIGLVDKLHEREAEVVRMRFGLPPYDRPHKMHEIGAKFGFTESRASQVVSENLDILYSMLPHDMRFRRRATEEASDSDESIEEQLD